jgi:Fe-S cluster assembly ATPase SufC
MYLYKLVDIFVLDYDALTTRIRIQEELIQTAYSPKRIQRLLDEGIDIEELENTYKAINSLTLNKYCFIIYTIHYLYIISVKSYIYG